MPISTFIKGSLPLFLYDRIKLCRDIRVETFEGGHHLHLEGAEGAIAKWLSEEALNGGEDVDFVV